MEDQETGYGGLGIFLSGMLARRVNRWRQLYDPYFQKLDPHITLAYPPFIPAAQWPAMRSAIIECLRSFPAFRVRLEGVGIFEGKPLVLWINPQDGGVLLRMRQKLEACFPDFVPRMPFDYQPHLSVGFFQDADALLRAQAQLEAGWRPISFTARELMYAVQTGAEEWEVRDHIPLLGK